MNLTPLAALASAARDRAPDAGQRVAILGALTLVAPLEHASGLALSLGNLHAWTVTLAIEGAAGSALLAGRLVGPALALTGSSVLLGALWSAHHQRPLTGPRDPRAFLAYGITLLVVASLALAHAVRAQILQARAAAAAKQRADDEQAAAAARAWEMETARLADDAERHRLAVEARETEAQRRHEAELVRARAYDEQERERLAVERERVRAQAAREEAEAVRVREAAAVERERLAAQRAADERRREEVVSDREASVKDRERATAERETARQARDQAAARSLERLAGPLDEAGREWRRLADDGQAPDAEALAEARGCSVRTAQNVISQWRRLHAVVDA